MVQLPVPKHIDEKTIINAIAPNKDVDAFHPVNVGKIMVGNYDFVPCTPAGVMELIKESGIDVSGKECVIVGRSNIVGKPQAMLLLHQNGTVTICHSKTKNLAEKIIELTDSNSKIIYKPLPSDDPIKRRPDLTLARKELNYEPRIQLEEGLEKTIDYFKGILQ